jgi:hypothetical protein
MAFTNPISTDAPLFQEIIHYGEADGIGTDPHYPIPFDTLKKEIFDDFLYLLYFGIEQLEQLSGKTGSISNGLAWIGTSLMSLHLLYDNLSFFKDDYYHLIFE